MRKFLNACRIVLTSLIRETILFTAAVDATEAYPEAAKTVARACKGLVEESLSRIQDLMVDEMVEEAYKKLRLSLSILDALSEGKAMPDEVGKYLPPDVLNKPLLLLDIAHSLVHEAIDLLKGSEAFRGYRDLLRLLSEARKSTAPKSVYRLIYRLAKEK